jgi:hypothetical protein
MAGRRFAGFETARCVGRVNGMIEEEETLMDIYTYFFFSYGLTAIIAYFTVGLILVTNKILKKLEGPAGSK